MSSIVEVRGVKLGEGRPKICVPVTDSGMAGLKRSAELIRGAPHDLVEWRADFFNGVEDPERRLGALTLLRGELGETPLLFTVRTAAENGMLDTDAGTYVRILLDAVDCGMADLVDVELSRGDKIMRTVAEAAHRAGLRVVGSRHDFGATPDRDVIVGELCRMQELGADVVKYAVMPRCERDVLTLLDATLTMKEEHGGTPVITMSMGSMGAVSRICGQVFGSCVTFGAVGSSSAPGQLPAGSLSVFLDALSR